VSKVKVQREKLRDIDAVPAKDILKNKAAVCPPLSAFCEILDNVFDNYEENGERRDLSISIIFVSNGNREISIAENSGGIRDAKLEPLVRLGVPYHGVRGSIGTWGEGFKVAAFSLGSEVEVLTHYPGEQPVTVHFDENWLSSTDWTVPVYLIMEDVPSPGTTEFRIRHIHREIDWAEIMRQVAVIYGHKIQSILDNGRRVRLDFEIDGRRTTITPRPLASNENLRKRLVYLPEFAPRQFTATFRADHGTVNCHLIVGLSPHHSGETSGVYMYGNGRLFARALRSRAVGYGESGNAVLRDHPSCWRIHAYAFFEADNGADIPWQAPLKDGVSENHPVTSQFREMFKEAVTPYSRIARIAKASELVPFTNEWEEMNEAQKAEVIFRNKSSAAVQQFRELPKEIRQFIPPKEVEMVRLDGVVGGEMIKRLDQHAKYLRQIISKRDEVGPALQLDVLKALSPKAFATEKSGRNGSSISTTASLSLPPPTKRIVIELEQRQLQKLRDVFGTGSDADAAKSAIAYAIKAQKTGIAKSGKRR
jgi:hypothetical protein